jgi:copper chaperone CopZ
MDASVNVRNLKCGGCAKAITKKIHELDNISNVLVSIEESKVSFNYNNASDLDYVIQKLKDIGYPLMEEHNTTLTKMRSYVSCAIGKL